MDECLNVYLRQDDPQSEGVLRAVYARLEAEGTAKTVFYDGTVDDADGVVADVLRKGSLPFLLLWQGKWAGFSWFNTLEGRSARGHFVIFKEFWGERAFELVHQGFAYTLNLRDASGYFFDVLLGVTPRRNALAWRMGLRAGAVMVGVIPHGVYMSATKTTEDAVLVAVTRESLEQINFEIIQFQSCHSEEKRGFPQNLRHFVARRTMCGVRAFQV